MDSKYAAGQGHQPVIHFTIERQGSRYLLEARESAQDQVRLVQEFPSVLAAMKWIEHLMNLKRNNTKQYCA